MDGLRARGLATPGKATILFSSVMTAANLVADAFLFGWEYRFGINDRGAAGRRPAEP